MKKCSKRLFAACMVLMLLGLVFFSCNTDDSPPRIDHIKITGAKTIQIYVAGDISKISLSDIEVSVNGSNISYSSIVLNILPDEPGGFNMYTFTADNTFNSGDAIKVQGRNSLSGNCTAVYGS